jgi:hypothetical protein
LSSSALKKGIEIDGEHVHARIFPWGIAEVDNRKHSDFSRLRSGSERSLYFLILFYGYSVFSIHHCVFTANDPSLNKSHHPLYLPSSQQRIMAVL